MLPSVLQMVRAHWCSCVDCTLMLCSCSHVRVQYNVGAPKRVSHHRTVIQMAIPNVFFTSPSADWGLSGGSGSNTLFSPADDQTRASGQVTVVGPAEPKPAKPFQQNSHTLRWPIFGPLGPILS